MDDFRNIDDGYKSWASKLKESKPTLMLISFVVGIFVGAVMVGPWVASMLPKG